MKRLVSEFIQKFGCFAIHYCHIIFVVLMTSEKTGDKLQLGAKLLF